MKHISLTKIIPALTLFVLFPLACQDKENMEPAKKGGACDPNATAESSPELRCDEGLVCEPMAGGQGNVCGIPVDIYGMVVDSAEQSPIVGARVTALDQTSAPVTDVAITDSSGHYVLRASALRDAQGDIAQDVAFTLQAFAIDYQPFPAGIRPAIPVDTQASEDETTGVLHIENPTTTIELIKLPPDQRGGVTIEGSVQAANPGGVLITAENLAKTAPYTVTDLSGSFALFNVPSGQATIRGYRAGLQLEPANLTVGTENIDDVVLAAQAEQNEQMATVSGSINIVNAPGGSVTSVVLVPTSVFNETVVRGPVPFGLRAPNPGVLPNLSSGSQFTIQGVPTGDYKVLAAFENDNLVRDPDEGIAGTDIQEINVPSENQTVSVGDFKITEALAIIGPGANVPEAISGNPTFEFADDSSEDGYELRLYNALGELVWESLNLPAVMGGSTVTVNYEGPQLEVGMYYQFRVLSFRDKMGERTAISQTEDLRGVFFVE